jgi:uncharacterized protein with HEPN domain
MVHKSGPPDDRDRLTHMLEAAEDALRFAANRVREDIDRDSMLLRALFQCIEVIGEAASRTSPEGRRRIPRVPWQEIIKMRNILVHAYWGIDRDRVWNTVRDDLPPLVTALRSALAAWPEGHEK